MHWLSSSSSESVVVGFRQPFAHVVDAAMRVDELLREELRRWMELKDCVDEAMRLHRTSEADPMQAVVVDFAS